MIGNVWSMHGNHLPTDLVNDGIFEWVNEWNATDENRDILMAASEKRRKETYRALQDALKEGFQEVADSLAQEQAHVSWVEYLGLLITMGFLGFPFWLMRGEKKSKKGHTPLWMRHLKQKFKFA